MTDVNADAEAPAHVEAPAPKPPVRAIVVANGSVPANSGAIVVVVEQRTDDGKLAEAKYGAGANAYLRMSADTDMGIDPGASLYTLGDNVTQHGFSGLSTVPGLVAVGPASPIYAGVNLAYLMGGRDIEVVGATTAQVTQLKPWFDTIATDGVTVSIQAP